MKTNQSLVWYRLHNQKKKAGMDEVAGHIAYMHLRKNVPVEENHLESLKFRCDYETRKCKVYNIN